MDLVTVWFAIVVLCWVLFFTLEGFDFGVGVLAPLVGRDEHERGAALKTIGPFWDGNEVWLVAAIGVTYAAFPAWYAALLSGTYLPMVGVLLLLAGRGVALEFRGKHSDPRWRRRCEVVLALCSAGIVALWGALLSVFVRGLALGADGEVVSQPGLAAGLGRTVAPLFTVEAAFGAVAALVLSVLLGATFLALRTTGPVRLRAHRVAAGAAAGVVALGAAVAVAGLTGATLAGGAIGASTGATSTGLGLLVVGALVAAAAVVVAVATRLGREGAAFAVVSLLVAGVVVAVLLANGDVVLPSTLDPAASLTRESAAATPAALGLITAFGAVAVPGVVVYQVWSYWVFRRRVASERIATA
ncbi:cytochrome bd-I ubiquinol oxidase subunit 2 apoprotein [Quadrisphaera granulorum]|uniref:Cytochrome bd-I ubiquinol oxidase subunit 2 apoprotein n=1 Tax=Quadrisphaera granulorum TaxID=317664 RepID=A0A316AAR6_9ACTN|nr:cytochrome d ubiquinol oxidase subunit II [Quadrisphaera granulorum]PWJ54100.1 cytochrome bd-I ubiquinol oxidase subunit 2 apoprotein [Quadrisphaera granulorum]SZE96239.1 cytochrome bd-I ubiquinol oxidase subunit 2 apoprotein [Quadrisphaera granulorum]